MGEVLQAGGGEAEDRGEQTKMNWPDINMIGREKEYLVRWLLIFCPSCIFTL